MEAWEQWLQMAQGALKAAQSFEEAQEHRSSASRAYYAAYQAMTAVLHYYKRTPPDDREAWSHTETPELIRNLQGSIIKQDSRKDIALRLQRAYRLRLDADYIASAEIAESNLKISLKDASFIVKLVKDILP